MEERQSRCPAVSSSQSPSCSTLKNPGFQTAKNEGKDAKWLDIKCKFECFFFASTKKVICKSGVIFTPVSNVMQRRLGGVEPSEISVRSLKQNKLSPHIRLCNPHAC